MPPNGQAANATATKTLRLLTGANSPPSARKLGTAPPSPSPVQKRTINSAGSVVTCAVRRLKAPKMATAATMKRLRPKRSASGPKLSAPSAAPTSAAENTGPNVSRGRWNASAIAGAV